MKIRNAKILKIGIGFSILVVTSCEERTIAPVYHHEKCQDDGANLYIKCSDGREKTVKLGYGKFFIMNGGRVPEANEFCGKEPASMAVNLKNAHYLFKVENLGNVVVTMPGSIHAECSEIEDYGDLRNVKRAKIETAPILGPALVLP